MTYRRWFCLVLLLLLLIGVLSSEQFAYSLDAETFYKNGYIYFSQNNFEKAKESYQQAIQIKPDYWDEMCIRDRSKALSQS